MCVYMCKIRIGWSDPFLAILVIEKNFNGVYGPAHVCVRLGLRKYVCGVRARYCVYACSRVLSLCMCFCLCLRVSARMCVFMLMRFSSFNIPPTSYVLYLLSLLAKLFQSFA